LEGFEIVRPVGRRFIGVQVGRSASENCFSAAGPNMKCVVNSRVKSDVIGGVHHLGEAKDVGNVVWIVVDFSKTWDLCFEVQSTGASVGVHSNRMLGGLNVTNKVWVVDCAVDARTRV